MRHRASILGLGLVALTRAPKLRHRLWRWWYDLLARLDGDGDLRLMNYGYVPLSGDRQYLQLEPSDEPFRYPLQLYDHVVSRLKLTGKDVVDVGCGRGGGAAFLATRYKPASLIGIDLSPVAVARCRAAYQASGLCFAVGRAEALALAANCADVVVNVESSHCYADMARFLREVVRVLRPGGYLAFCDLRTTSGMANLREDIAACGLKTVQEEEINQQVVKALQQVAEQRTAQIEQRVPAIGRRLMANFVGAPDTPMFDMLRTGRMEYRHWLLRKRLDDSASSSDFLGWMP
jgi:ubiquinone/menaquinone biosynthesis C-methylase UbiE